MIDDRYQEIKKIINKAGLAQMHTVATNDEWVEGFDISSGEKENNSSLEGEVVLHHNGNIDCSMSFGDNNRVDITTVKGVKSLLKGKQEILNNIAQLKRDLKVIESLEQNIAKYDPELLLSAIKSIEKKPVKKYKVGALQEKLSYRKF